MKTKRFILVVLAAMLVIIGSASALGQNHCFGVIRRRRDEITEYLDKNAEFVSNDIVNNPPDSKPKWKVWGRRRRSANSVEPENNVSAGRRSRRTN